ncbi:acyl transferase/acyl hydrolase/lysophospholipase [Chytriomyces sp. MP71]|nr:acyl transferase/acyl hydrolase/lysophospholipase [Chytriomyces sp. MP71]
MSPFMRCFGEGSRLSDANAGDRETQTWSASDESPIYDYNLIRFRLDSLRTARQQTGPEGQVEISYALRSGLLRNLGGLNDQRLYSKRYLGTKNLIHDYHKEVVGAIKYLSEKCAPHPGKTEALTDMRQSFGRTALVFQGGASFALIHLGVAKALFENGLLPRVISGSSISALMASLICITTDAALPKIFDTTGIHLEAFEGKRQGSGWRRRIARLFQTGYLLDVHVLEEVVNSNLGDITFEEAFKKTQRILNISVSSARKNEVPRLLNYLTAPTVLIRTAACASASALGIFSAIDLLAKDKNGNIVPWGSSKIKWGDSSYDS